MKSEHRHELETNTLAKQLDVAVERLRPYASTIAGVIVAVVVVMFLWSYLAGSSSARQSQAWDEYNQAVTEITPDVERLRQAAQEHPGTEMQQLSDITWADSQVYLAARDYLYNRSAAMEALTKATSAYQGLLQSTKDERLTNRAKLGLARIYEIQGKLSEAGTAYSEVKGTFEEYAKRQAERLAKPEAKETYEWLASARPPAPRSSPGFGLPGQRPEFSEGDMALPSATGTGSPTGAAGQDQSIDDLLRGLKLDFGTDAGADPYAPSSATPGQPGDTPSGTTPPSTTAPPSTTLPPATKTPESTGGSAPAATEGAPAANPSAPATEGGTGN